MKKVKPNLSTDLKKSSVLKIAYYTYNNSYIAQNKKQTKLTKIGSVSKILFIIGLLKRDLGSANTFFDKINLNNKMIRVLASLDQIVREYNLDLSNLKEKLSTSTIEYIRLINDNNEQAFIGDDTASLISSGLINKLESINLFESNNDIKKFEILNIYLNSLFISKVFTEYVKIIDVSSNNDLYINTLQSLNKINVFIKFLESIDNNVKTFNESSFEIKKKIIMGDIENYIDALLN